jgi:Uncharacterised protein family (UPF0158)
MTERPLSITFDDLEMAFDDASGAARYYLDLETGQVLMITDEIRDELEAIYRGFDDERAAEDDAFAAALEQHNLPDWMREMVAEAHQVEQGYGTRYIAVPTADAHEGYRAMEDFIDTVANQRLQAQLAQAIQGRGAFRRFKDTLLGYPGERERWFAFSRARMRERALAWLEDEGITAILE